MSGSFVYFIFFLSGISGLGYELLWTKMFATSLGHETVAVFAVVSAFFGGIACGAWALDGLLSRTSRPGFMYALLESFIGIWAVTLLFLLPLTNMVVAEWIGVNPGVQQHWFLAFLYPFVILFPATFAMGGTLPAMDRFYSIVRRRGDNVAGLYGVNTLGAVAGVLLLTYLLLPVLGFWKGALVLVFCNFVCMLATLFLDKNSAASTTLQTAPAEGGAVAGTLRSGIFAVLFVTGFAGIGFEVLMVRGVSQIFDNSVYSFASMLVVFLCGNGIGALAIQKLLKKSVIQAAVPRLLLATAAFCLVSVILSGFGESVFRSVAESSDYGLLSIIGSEIIVSMLYLFLPAVAMGATFGCLAQLLKNKNGGVGVALSLNTLGGTVAPLVFGVILVPAVGLKTALLVVVLLYTGSALVLHFFQNERDPRNQGFAAIIVLVAVWVQTGLQSSPFLHFDRGEKLIEHREGVMASVDVIAYPDNSLHLRVNNHFQMGGTGSVYSDRRQAYLPLLLHPNPKNVLCLGVGAGITLSSFEPFADIAVTGVELVPEVIDVLPRFSSLTGKLTDSSHLNIVNADARRYVSATHDHFDIVLADLFHPARDGAGSLYTAEHFQAIRSILSKGGIFCQWLPLYQLDLETLKIITHTFLSVFPKAQMFLAHYSLEQPIIGLIGSEEEMKFPENWFHERVRGKNFVKQMGVHGYDSVYSLLGTFLAGPESLAEWARGAAINNDMHPVVTYKAPQIFAENGASPGERLLTLVDDLESRDPEDILAEVVTEEDYLARERMVSYWQARDTFLHLGESVPKTRDVEQLYQAAGKPLLGVVRQSLDFTSAYFPLVSIAYNLYPVDRNSSFKLLHDLERANPLRPEAGLLRERLFTREETADLLK